MKGKISEAFNILKGTEQGHPLSPEFFKAYFKKLSDLLNEATANCPTLAGLSVTHLAWADDMVILALDPESLQKLLTFIGDYCNEWGNQHLKNQIYGNQWQRTRHSSLASFHPRQRNRASLQLLLYWSCYKQLREILASK